MSMQLFVPTFRVEECLAEIRECLEKGWTGLGFKTVQFEEEWKKYTGLPHAHFLNSATAGLHLAVKILKDDYAVDEDFRRRFHTGQQTGQIRLSQKA